jgi:cation transport ATPase
VQALRAAGVQRTALLSGDNLKTVQAIGTETGVDELHGQLLPEDKVRVIGELEAKYGKSAMIGDGVNDAPALARASVGIAMGGIGSDAAMESADEPGHRHGCHGVARHMGVRGCGHAARCAQTARGRLGARGQHGGRHPERPAAAAR